MNKLKRTLASLFGGRPCLMMGALMFPVLSLAQSGETTEEKVFELDVFEVTTEEDFGYQSTHASEVTRMNTAIRDIPMSVTILNQEFIEDTLARSTEDVLEYVPGFVPTSNNDAWVIRGFSNANTKFMNGFLQQESIGKVSVANVDRVEVLRGPAAVLFGQGGFAATVNRVTKRPLEKQSTMLSAGYGPLGSVRYEIDTTGPIGDSPFMYRLTGVLDNGEYYRKTPHDEEAIGAALTWKIARKTRVTFEYLYVIETDGGAVWRQPMWKGEPNGFEMPDGTFLSTGDNRQGFSAPGDLREWKRGFTMVDFQHAFSDNWQLRVQFASDTKDQLYNETQPEQGSLTFLKDAVLMPKRWRIRTQDVDNQRSRNELVGRFRTGPATHRVLLGFSWDKSDAHVHNRESRWNRGGLKANDSKLNQQWPSGNVGSRLNTYPDLTLAEFLTDVRLAGFNPYMIPPVNVLNPRLSPVVSRDEAEKPPLISSRNTLDITENTEFYLADMIAFANERFFLTGGLRRTNTTNVRADFRRDGEITADNEADSTTYSFGTVYHLNEAETLTLYANANSSFIPEFRRQPDGTALDPEEGNQKEMGLRFSARESRIQGLFSVYEIKQQNVAREDPLDEDRYIQIDGLRSRGFEFSVNAELSDKLRVYGGYAYTDARDSDSGARVHYVPYHHFSAFSRYSFDLGNKRKELDLMLGTIYTGERLIEPDPITSLGGIDNAPLWIMPGEWRVDLSMRYRYTPPNSDVRWEFRAKIQNLFDNQEIYKLADRVSLQRQPGFTWQIEARLRF